MTLRCDECGLIFSYPKHYVNHLQEHRYGPFRLTQEETEAKPLQGYVCPECGKVYTYLVSFRKHLQEHRKDVSGARGPALNKYSCPFCQMVFVRMRAFQAHLRNHHGRHLRCDQCAKTFVFVETYLSHMELHWQNPLWCVSCCRGFRDEASMHQHLERHLLGKHKCSLCSQQFLSEDLLRRHSKASHPTCTPAPSSPGEGAESADSGAPQAETQPESAKCDITDLEDELESEECDCGEPSCGLDTVANPKKPQRYWECVECDEGFDDISVLHHHYMLHAAGEIHLPGRDV